MTGGAPKIPKETLEKRQQLVDIYIRAQRRLEKQLSSSALTDFARFRIQEQLSEVNAIVAALNADLKNALPGVISSYYKYGADLAGVALEAQGIKIAALNLGNRIHTAAVQAVAEQMVLDLSKANLTIKDSAQRILRVTQQALVEEKAINKIIAEGLVTGETRRETSARLARDLKERLRDGKFVQAGKSTYTPEKYAELVTRTRTREAVTQGAITRSMEFGITLFQISIHDAPCDVCKQYQGKVYSVVEGSEFPMMEARPPFHPHCVLPETAIFAPGQRAASVATYNGPIVDLRLSNSALVSVTPNHMFLTPTGFAFAKDLCEGDDVLCSPLFEDVVLRNPNNNNRPAFIADVVETLAKTSGMGTTSVPVSPEYLHGDARFMNGNIDIVRPDSLLTGCSESEILEHFRHLDFSRADIALMGLTGCRDTASMLEALATATNSLVGFGRERQAALWSELRHAKKHGLAPGSLLDSPLLQDSIDHHLRTGESLDKLPNAFPGNVAFTDFLGGKQLSGSGMYRDSGTLDKTNDTCLRDAKLLSDITAAHPGLVGITKVSSKGFRNYSGQVYDLQSMSTLYLCNSLVSSNCRHVAIPYFEAPGREDKHKALIALSKRKEPIADSLPGYQEAVEQAKLTGGFREEKRIPGEPR